MINKIRHSIYRAKYVHGKKIPLSAPVDVSLELASACNMSCGYCYHADKSNLPFTPGIMPWRTAQKIIRQAYEMGVNSLKFNWKGESTLNPNFYNITSYARSLANGSTFIDRLTNSNFKFPSDREDIFKGLCNQTKVKISYDSFQKKVFETQRSGGNHDLTTRNIDLFYNHPERKNTEIVIQAVRTKLNKDEDLETEIKKRWPEATVSIRDMVEGRVTKDLGHLTDRHRSDERQSCIQAHVRLIFNWKGEAFPCCPDISEKLNLGSIHRKSLKDIFKSDEARRLRKDLKSGKAFDSDPCKTCSSFESYKGYRPAWAS